MATIENQRNMTAYETLSKLNIFTYDNMKQIDINKADFDRIISGIDGLEWITYTINGIDYVGCPYYDPNEDRLYHLYYDEDFIPDEDDECYHRVAYTFVFFNEA